MNKIATLLTSLTISLFSMVSMGQDNQIAFKHHADQQEIEIWIGGIQVSTYLYHDDLKKPVLYPITTLGGKVLTRGYPLEIRPGERVDHRHHLGHWFNYGDVNGLDFWNNSSDRPVEKRAKYGEVRHKEIIRMDAGEGKGELEIRAEWVNHQGEVLLEEHTVFIFQRQKTSWSMDRISTLRAVQDLSFTDNKEGMFAIRLRRELELPSEKPAYFADKQGKPMTEKGQSHVSATGDYLSSEGIQGSEVWGKRAAWVKLTGMLESQQVEIVILDHPNNVGYPTYWHARGYGLFSANPLGQKVFSKGKEELNFQLVKGESQTFRYRILFHEGKTLRSTDIKKFQKGF